MTARLIFAAYLFLASCALVPATQSRTLGDRADAAEVVATAALDRTTDLVTSGALPPVAARATGSRAVLVFLAVRAARAALVRGDAGEARERLDAVRADLKFLEEAVR